MSRSDQQRIDDIIEAAHEIAAFVSKGRETWNADHAVQLATERLLEIIGEAANQLSDETCEMYRDVQWRDITRLRIVLAHHYHRVDPNQVWSIAAEYVPVLLQSLKHRDDD